MTDYTEPLVDGMRVRHDAQARFTVKAGRQVLEDSLTPIETIGGAMTRASFMYNARSMSGAVSWWNPATGKPISRPKVSIRVRPEDVLRDDALCTCSACS
jgi:hypothetical protein